MSDLRRSVLSLDYVNVPVRDIISDADPTADTVRLAFPVAGASPVSGDWKAASWVIDSDTTPATYYARCLVGTGGTVALAVGSYDVWAELTDTPGVPILKAPGSLVIF